MLQRPVLLAVAVLSTLAWLLWGFVFPVGVGAIHALFAVAAISMVRWWALTR